MVSYKNCEFILTRSFSLMARPKGLGTLIRRADHGALFYFDPKPRPNEAPENKQAFAFRIVKKILHCNMIELYEITRFTGS